MARLPILEFPDPRLRTRAAPVEHFDAALGRRVLDLLETMYAAHGIGLAATQVDVHRRVVVIDVSETKDALLVFVNPEIYDPSEDNENRLRIMVDAVIRVADYQRTGVASAGIPQDPVTAARTYLNIATTYGHPAAQYGLGIMNMKGLGMKQNPQQGLKWLIAAARKRHAPAEAYLGELYMQGKYVQADRTRAVMWYMLAAKTANPDEFPNIFNRLSVLENMATEDERLEAAARARIWDEQYPPPGRMGF